MKRPANERDIVGKTIGWILQSDWEHWEEYSFCNFYIELSDGTLVQLNEDSLEVVDPDVRASLGLRDVDGDSDFPTFWSSDGYTGVGATIERALVDSYKNVFVQVSGRHFLNAEHEARSILGLHEYDSFLHYAGIFEFFDYWTKQPCIFENMRAIDLIITSGFDDLVLAESRRLHLTIGRVRDGIIGDLLVIPNDARKNGWTARFVVPAPGTYRILVHRRSSEFSMDVNIDESVIAAGRLDVHVA